MSDFPDWDAIEDAALLEWARNAPKGPSGYDGDTFRSEDDYAFYQANIKRWLEQKPRVRNKDDYDR